ncbi:hypothetical protein BHF71_10570 [Vulcanibacillus modesticaldus]|uniref:Uncharacterized protein n=1 Tax=Vulcanibacillus modesticaldus TaxID=337097 RepID=A0A1D2YTE7_9BACI|nr:hypothetical protein [Vulcanibacillus modesticaldus]OEF98946.1 hypothetical protein BHF71_10570 [Vulcanibacillus modesticaldus]
MDITDTSKISYLEMIQGVITRMSTNSFILKGWAITLIAGILAFASTNTNKMYFLVAYIPILIFWFLDSYYLQLERKYRKLYDKARMNQENDFNMEISISNIGNDTKLRYFSCFFAPIEIWFYLPSIILVAIMSIIAI